MKSLKPIQDETSTTLIASDVKAELDNKIASIQTSQNKLENEVDELSEEVSKKAIIKDNVTALKVNADVVGATMVTSDEASIVNISADTITANTFVETPLLRSSEISVNDASIHHLDNDTINSIEITSDKIETTDLKADNVETKTVTTDEMTSTHGDVRNLSVDNLEAMSLGSPNSLDVAVLNTSTSNEEEANIETANIKLSEQEKARVKYSYNQMKAFCDDETDATQFIRVGDTENSETTDEYHIIRIPRITSGWYRIELKEQQNNDENNHDGNTLFSLNYYQTETTPIIQYSKKNISDLTNFYYDSTTDYLYVKTYGTGYLYWASDAKDFFGAPVIFSELPIDESAKETFVFNSARSHQWVMIGNHTGEYGLTVQGVIEGDIVKDWNKITDINFYGNDVSSLYLTCRAYFKRTFNDEDIYGHSVEVYGYVYHTKPGNAGEYSELEYEVPFTATAPSYILLNGEYVEIKSITAERRIGGGYNVVFANDTENIYSTKPIVYTRASLRDHWNTEVEALEKICMPDKDTIVLTVDSKYGQDDITISLADEEMQWVEHTENIVDIANDSELWDKNENEYTWKKGVDPYMYTDEGTTLITKLTKKTNGSWVINDMIDVPPTNILTYYTQEPSVFTTLPFVVGFTFRSMNSDYLLNLDSFRGDSSVFNEGE